MSPLCLFSAVGTLLNLQTTFWHRSFGPLMAMDIKWLRQRRGA